MNLIKHIKLIYLCQFNYSIYTIIISYSDYMYYKEKP